MNKLDKTTVIHLTAVTKPRMTQRDKWKKRPCVVRYWKYKDAIRQCLNTIPQPCTIWFEIPMPKSWSKKKRQSMNRKPHLAKPDKDNLEKGLLDAIYDDDSHIWNARVIKTWCDSEVGKITIIDETDFDINFFLGINIDTPHPKGRGFLKN